ncbi:protein of unknown function [Streptomyces murinus]
MSDDLRGLPGHLLDKPVHAWSPYEMRAWGEELEALKARRAAVESERREREQRAADAEEEARAAAEDARRRAPLLHHIKQPGFPPEFNPLAWY